MDVRFQSFNFIFIFSFSFAFVLNFTFSCVCLLLGQNFKVWHICCPIMHIFLFSVEDLVPGRLRKAMFKDFVSDALHTLLP